MPDREISFLLALLRGISGGNLEWEQEKEHFYNIFKRVFGISELEQKLTDLGKYLGFNRYEDINGLGKLKTTVESFELYKKELAELKESLKAEHSYIYDVETWVENIDEVLQEDVVKAFDLILKRDTAISRNDNEFFGDGIFHQELAKHKNNIYRKLSGEKELASLREEIKNGDIMVLEPLMKDITELKEALREHMSYHKSFHKPNDKAWEYFHNQYKKLSGEKSEDDLTPGTARASSTDSKPESCQTCLYENNMKDDNTCGMCNPNTPQSHWTPKKKRAEVKER